MFLAGTSSADDAVRDGGCDFVGQTPIRAADKAAT